MNNLTMNTNNMNKKDDNNLKIYKKKLEAFKQITVLNVPNHNLEAYEFNKNLKNFPNLIELDCYNKKLMN